MDIKSKEAMLLWVICWWACQIQQCDRGKEATATCLRVHPVVRLSTYPPQAHMHTHARCMYTCGWPCWSRAQHKYTCRNSSNDLLLSLSVVIQDDGLLVGNTHRNRMWIPLAAGLGLSLDPSLPRCCHICMPCSLQVLLHKHTRPSVVSPISWSLQQPTHRPSGPSRIWPKLTDPSITGSKSSYSTCQLAWFDATYDHTRTQYIHAPCPCGWWSHSNPVRNWVRMLWVLWSGYWGSPTVIGLRYSIMVVEINF